MIEIIIDWSINNSLFVWCGSIVLITLQCNPIYETPVDSLPDLSESQVIVYTEGMARNYKIMENQVTISTNLCTNDIISTTLTMTETIKHLKILI